MSCNRLEDDAMLAELGGTMDPHVAGCADCQARLRGHQRIAGWIADGETGHRAPPDWAARTLARVGASRGRRRRTAVLVGAAAAVALVLGVALWRRPRAEPEAPRLAIQIVEQAGWRGEAHAGQQLRARATAAGAAHFELRVYRGARDLLVRCPTAGPPACLEGGALLAWRLPSVATYQVVLLISPRPLAAPVGSLDADVAAATADGARVVAVETLHVD